MMMAGERGRTGAGFAALKELQRGAQIGTANACIQFILIDTLIRNGVIARDAVQAGLKMALASNSDDPVLTQAIEWMLCMLDKGTEQPPAVS
jgi:hypothetical protein